MNRHHALAEMDVFDFPFLLPEFSGCPSVIIGDFQPFHV
ncbi:hypothetical protein B4168_2610 [Anoxybacillus flavithermus]|nr:hypothetical protein B4168_2610 [Anoxybacillus flavithermus]